MVYNSLQLDADAPPHRWSLELQDSCSVFADGWLTGAVIDTLLDQVCHTLPRARYELVNVVRFNDTSGIMTAHWTQVYEQPPFSTYLLQNDVCFFPVNISNRHWTLVCAFITDAAIYTVYLNPIREVHQQ